MRLRISDLERTQVETESGRRLGHLFDVSVEMIEGSGGPPEAKMLLLGRGGLARRLGIGRGQVQEVEISSIVRVEPGRVIVSG